MLLDDVLGDGFALVGRDCDPRAGLSSSQVAQLRRLGTTFATLYPFGGRPQGLNAVAHSSDPNVIELEDMSGVMVDWFRKAGFARGGVAILRPDRFAFAVVPIAQTGFAVDALCAQLGLREAAAAAQPRVAAAASP